MGKGIAFFYVIFLKMRSELFSLTRTLTLLLTVIMTACQSDEEKREELQKGILAAKELFLSTESDPALSRHYLDSMRYGVSPAEYAASALKEKDGLFHRFEGYRPPSIPWTIVVRLGSSSHEVFIEGYGGDQSHPLITEHLKLTFDEYYAESEKEYKKKAKELRKTFLKHPPLVNVYRKPNRQ